MNWIMSISCSDVSGIVRALWAITSNSWQILKGKDKQASEKTVNPSLSNTQSKDEEPQSKAEKLQYKGETPQPKDGTQTQRLKAQNQKIKSTNQKMKNENTELKDKKLTQNLNIQPKNEKMY